MNSQLTNNAEALRLFFTEDIFLVNDNVEMAVATTIPVDLRKEQEVSALPTLSVQIEKTKIEPKKSFDFEFLGKNQKGILILVNDNANKVSSVQGTELLRKLVKAIELTNNDFALVNYANYIGANFEDLNGVFNCQLVLSFGVSAQQLGLSEQEMHQLHKLNAIKLVFAKNLHDLDADVASKKTLWASLQQLKS